jgi:replicative DNA helicase
VSPRDFDIKTLPDALAEYTLERTSPDYEPIRLGLGLLDDDTRGVCPGELYGIAARQGVGKSFMLTAVAQNVAKGHANVGALILSVEMPGTQWAERQFAVHEDVSAEEVERWAKEGTIADRIGTFSSLMRNTLLCDEHFRIEELPALIDQAQAKLSVPLRVIYVDYLGMIGTENRNRSTYEQVTAIVKNLKAVAKSKRVAVVCAMQLSREGGDGSVEVTSTMLRDSGAIEETCDYLVGCWREDKATGLDALQEVAVRDRMSAVLLKNRKGRDGRVIELLFRERSRLLEPVNPSPFDTPGVFSGSSYGN